ncbi:MAG: hypothetical protein HY701_02400, partial [Gemmatimonadetes bacterium]|nr:hypothetical protein [Gemmatimonadota bacterium]
FEMFFAGDGEVMANQRWRTQFSGYTAELEVLKVGHHGANDAIFDNGFSGSSAWLQHTSPDLGVLSANGTTHPRRNAIERLLAQAGLRTLCTNVHGTIEIRVAPSGVYRVDTARSSSAPCTPGSEATT